MIRICKLFLDGAMRFPLCRDSITLSSRQQENRQYTLEKCSRQFLLLLECAEWTDTSHSIPKSDWHLTSDRQRNACCVRQCTIQTASSNLTGRPECSKSSIYDRRSEWWLAFDFWKQFWVDWLQFPQCVTAHGLFKVEDLLSISPALRRIGCA